MMSRVAAPDYATNQPHTGLPAGHRFSLYLPLWNSRWEIDAEAKNIALKQCRSLGDAATLLTALRARQQAQAEALPAESCLVIDAVASSPFATGLGNEHPVENGFAFLTPYGLPYLAGSGVKGVLRRSMEELADERASGIDSILIDALFGPEDRSADGSGAPLADAERRRGTLSFWDVLPDPPNARLSVEVMTPHQSGYYQGDQSPHDAGQPVPINFLALPPQSKFRFIVTHESALMPAELREADWRAALGAAFQRAFDWLGFGAKTAVGYGAMRQDPEQQAKYAAAQKLQAEAIAAARKAAEDQLKTPEQLERESAEPQIANFRGLLTAERARNKYKAGSLFDQQRADFLQRALDWTGTAVRQEAAALLRDSFKFTDWPAKKERKQEVKQWLAQLDAQA